LEEAEVVGLRLVCGNLLDPVHRLDCRSLGAALKPIPVVNHEARIAPMLVVGKQLGRVAVDDAEDVADFLVTVFLVTMS
jgi:hypothetical protein